MTERTKTEQLCELRRVENYFEITEKHQKWPFHIFIIVERRNLVTLVLSLLFYNIFLGGGGRDRGVGEGVSSGNAQVKNNANRFLG